MTEVRYKYKILKHGGDKIKNKSIQNWIAVEEFFNNGLIKLKNKKIIKIIKVDPINFNLKSDLEKSAILNSYKIFLKTCNFNIQILIQSNKKNLNKIIEKINNKISDCDNDKLIYISNSYINFIKDVNMSKASSSKQFFIIIDSIEENEVLVEEELNEKYLKIKECLGRCGNKVEDVRNKKENIDIFYSFYNTRISNRYI